MTSFSEFGLGQDLIKAIDDLKFVHPTPVQEQAIPFLMHEDTDLIALAQTGTGKTAAFGLPLLNQLDLHSKSPQALVLCPTRELCVQITRDFDSFGKYLNGFKAVSVYGGAAIRNQIDQIRRGCQVIIATPGRLMDLMERKAIDITNVKFVVLDEADEMLNMGFREDMEFILGAIPGVHRTCLFSATMSREVRSIADRFLSKNAFTISIGKANTSALNISHQFAVVHQRDKYQALKRILDALPGFYGIVFCTTKIETQDISDKLIKDGYHADCMHGDLSQSQREKTLARFRHGAVRILLATDVAARGIDVSDLTHVVHYHLPDDIENYTHRSGRTARAGKSGISVVLLNVKEFYKIKRIEQTSGVKFERYMIPKGEDLVKNLIQKIMDEVELHVTSEEPWQLNAVEALSKYPSEKLAATLVSKMAGNIGTDPELLPDLNVYDRGRGGEDGAGDGYGQAKLFISLGAKDRLNVQSMKELVVEMSGIQPAQISSVIIKDTYSFLLVSPDIKTKVVEFMNGGSFGDRPIRIEETTPEQNSGRGRSGGGDRYGDRGRDRGGFSRGGDRGGYKKEGGSSGGSRYRGDSGGSSDRYRGDSSKTAGSSSDRPKRPSYGKDKPDSYGGKKRGGGGSNSGFKTRY